MHKLAHSGIKDKECTVCGLQLRSTSHLSRHMRVHSGEKPYACPTCGQKFAQRYNMMSHFKVHQGITRTNKIQKCTICSKTFTRKIKLDQHMSDCHLMPMPTLTDIPRAQNVYKIISDDSEFTDNHNINENNIIITDNNEGNQSDGNYFIAEIESTEPVLMKVEYVD